MILKSTISLNIHRFETGMRMSPIWIGLVYQEDVYNATLDATIHYLIIICRKLKVDLVHL